MRLDLLLLDVMTPGRDGFAVVQDLRGKKILTPVIFITGRDGVEDRVRGLDLGGDDYLVKPFSMEELLARARAAAPPAPAGPRRPARGGPGT